MYLCMYMCCEDWFHDNSHMDPDPTRSQWSYQCGCLNLDQYKVILLLIKHVIKSYHSSIFGKLYERRTGLRSEKNEFDRASSGC